MPDLDALALRALMDGGIFQYPDKNLYNAAVRLHPEERPTVPVRLYDDPARLYEETLRKIGGAPLTSGAVGVTPRDASAIYIKAGTPEHKDLYQLASKLAHEQVHVRQVKDGLKASAGAATELPAYEKELEVVSRFGSHIPSDYMTAIRNYVQRLRSTAQGNK